ncbi:MAG: 6-pyruvoyl trahydropterin synthase family protein [Tepidiformaceae bacterium]
MDNEGSESRRPVAMAANSEDSGRKVVPLRGAGIWAGSQSELASELVYEMGIDSFFGASHAMRPNGARHTHSFRVQASFVTEELDTSGMTVGFREVSNLLDAEAKRFASKFLNEIEPFTMIEPTGENLASVIFRNLLTSLQTTLPGGPKLIGVTLWENPTSYVRVGRQRAA